MGQDRANKMDRRSFLGGAVVGALGLAGGQYVAEKPNGLGLKRVSRQFEMEPNGVTVTLRRSVGNIIATQVMAADGTPLIVTGMTPTQIRVEPAPGTRPAGPVYYMAVGW